MRIPGEVALAVRVLDVQPDEVIGDVVLVKAGIHRLHVLLVIVVPPALVVTQCVDGREGLGSWMDEAAMGKGINFPSLAVDWPQHLERHLLTCESCILSKDVLGPGAQQDEGVNDATLRDPTHVSLRNLTGALHVIQHFPKHSLQRDTSQRAKELKSSRLFKRNVYYRISVAAFQ